MKHHGRVRLSLTVRRWVGRTFLNTPSHLLLPSLYWDCILAIVKVRIQVIVTEMPATPWAVAAFALLKLG
jgi:hypothetical protein